MGLWEKGRNLLDILHRLGDCKGGWRLAAGTRSCCKSPVIQNDENQLVDKMVKDEKSLKMKAAHLKTFVSTQNVCNADLSALCPGTQIFLSTWSCRWDTPVFLYKPPLHLSFWFQIL